MAEIRVLHAGDEAVLKNVAPGVFDNEVGADLVIEFLKDGRHHIAVAIEGRQVIGMASAVHYVHPDKRPQLFINEVAVASTYQRRGIGKALLSELLRIGKSFRCTEAWVLTDRANIAAMRMYSSLSEPALPTDHVMFTFRLDNSD